MIPVASLSVEICDFTQILVLFPGCSVISTGFSKGSMTFRYVRSSLLNCIEKKGSSGFLDEYRVWYCFVVGIRD